jgi:hypothetical protein
LFDAERRFPDHRLIDAGRFDGLVAEAQPGDLLGDCGLEAEKRLAGEEFNQALEASREVELTVTGRTSGREIACASAGLVMSSLTTSRSSASPRPW